MGMLFALPAGVWVDRLRRRPILVLSDLARAVLLASVPLAHAFDALTMWQLYAVVFGVGVGTVFFDVSYQSYLPSLVSREQLVDGNSKLEISRSGAFIAGPALAGVLVGAIAAPNAILVDALSFLASAAFRRTEHVLEGWLVREATRLGAAMPEAWAAGAGLRGELGLSRP